MSRWVGKCVVFCHAGAKKALLGKTTPEGYNLGPRVNVAVGGELTMAQPNIISI